MRHWIYHKYHHYNDFIVITKQEKVTYFLSIRILSDPNKVYLYLTLTLHNFTLPKNLHLSYLPHLRVLSIHISFEQGIFGVPLGNFFQFLLSIVFSCNKLLLSRSFTCHKLNNIYFKFILQFEHCFLVTNWYFHLTLHTHESNYFYFI